MTHEDQFTDGDDKADETRRQFLAGSAASLTLGSLATLSSTDLRAQSLGDSALSFSPFADSHELVPLPFDSSKLDGLSARLIDSHWSNNYGGSVRALNETSKRLAAALSDPDLPAYIYNGMKREHLMRTGSVILHELYFENLGGSGKPDSETRNFIGSAFGSFDRWETEFRRIAMGLGGGSGWVVLAYSRHFHTIENYWMADHMHSPAASVPLLVMDMYEHSYQMDYGAATARYVDAFFANINWENVASRIDSI